MIAPKRLRLRERFSVTARRAARLCAGLAAAAAAAALLVAATSCILVNGRSGDSLKFPLAPHAKWISACTVCHAEIDTQQVDATTRRALESACLKCHGAERSKCDFCHTDADSAGLFPDRERYLTFSHTDHLKRTKGDCSRCHGAVHESGAAPAAADARDDHPTAIPGHTQCFSCHQMKDLYEQLDCTTCHRGLFRFGLKPYEEFTHSVDFVRREHGEFVRSPANRALCSQCHEPTFCSECHAEQPLLRPSERHPERVAADYIHKGDYVSTHPWDARTDPASCLRCHGRTSCEDCHTSRGISERGARQAGATTHFHGPGVLVRGSSDFHGSAARRDILSCASCHGEGASGNCVTCHAVGAFGGNPHPPGFKSRLSRTGAPVCRLCHAH
jgi:hypothetical protein